MIAAVYRDPLDDCMDGIEQVAAGILRTSRLTVQGEPGGNGHLVLVNYVCMCAWISDILYVYDKEERGRKKRELERHKERDR